MERSRVQRLGLLPAFAIALGGPACGRNGKQSPDAAVDAAPVDTMPPPDTGPKPLALDFSATGCTAFDLVNARCDGSAPLTLTFTPVASQDLTRFLWDFGDGSPPSSDRSPTHTYTLPNKYSVTLVGGGSGSGTVSRTHSDYVNVTGAAIGAWCDVNEQCADGLTCVCGSSSPCRPVLARGICTRTCDPTAAGAACPDGTNCADLASPATIAPASGAGSDSSGTALTPSQAIDGWRLPLCLPVCADDSACAVGFRCRDLLAPGGPVTWLKACFVAYPLAIGERCGDATGMPIDADCASHLCSDLGAFGRCSFDCGQTGCPTGTACGHLGDGRNLCLRVCAGTSSCSDDPLLDCEAPGAPGALGFSVGGDSGTPPPTTYCAPKTCAISADCGPAGSCPAGGGQCQRLTPPLATSFPVN